MRVWVSGGRQRMGARSAMTLAVVLFAVASCNSETAGAGSPASIITVRATVTVTSTVTAAAGPAAESSDAQPSGITPRQKDPDPCKLLTRAEASTLAGMELQAGIGAGSENGVNTLCEWTRDPNASGTGQVSIITGDGSKKALDIDKDTLKHKFTKVPGIGDECWQEDGGIWIRKGTVWVNIGLVLLDDPADDVTPMQQAAKIVAGRI